MNEGIRYKGVMAKPGSELHRLLTERDYAKTPKLAQEFQKKAEKCYSDCIARHKRSIGELSFHGWAPT